MSELRILDGSGDTKIIWDRNKQDEVDVARASFDSLKKKRYLAFAVKKDGEKGTQISEFDPTAEKIILAPPMTGG